MYSQIKMIIHPRISKTQHGGLSTRSIETNLMEFCTYIYSAFEQNAQVDTLYSDVRKAFDTVNQPLCIRKLSNFLIGNQTLQWFNSYSSNRKHCVKIGSALSEQFFAHSAIGQGTILGPTLFLTFFNDSDGEDGPSKSFYFADDKKKALNVKVPADTVKLQDEIDKFVLWCDENGLELNIKKCTSFCRLLQITTSKRPKLIEWKKCAMLVF